MIPVQLAIGAEASTKQGLVEALVAQARQFFGDEPFYLVAEVSAEAQVEVRTMQGGVEITSWTGQATFTNAEP